MSEWRRPGTSARTLCAVIAVGSVFFECPAGFFHPPNVGDLIIRDPRSWRPAPDGTPGVIQVLSLLPRSYPGHSLLTEDLDLPSDRARDETLGWGAAAREVKISFPSDA